MKYEINNYEDLKHFITEDRTYTRSEDAVADKANSYVDRTHEDFSAKKQHRLIQASGIDGGLLCGWIADNANVLMCFADNWLQSDIANDRSEEHPPEEPEDFYDPEIIERGLGCGFLINYAIFMVLCERDSSGKLLLSYIKKQKISSPSRVVKEIIRIFQEVRQA